MTSGETKNKKTGELGRTPETRITITAKRPRGLPAVHTNQEPPVILNDGWRRSNHDLRHRETAEEASGTSTAAGTNLVQTGTPTRRQEHAVSACRGKGSISRPQNQHSVLAHSQSDQRSNLSTQVKKQRHHQRRRRDDHRRRSRTKRHSTQSWEESCLFVHAGVQHKTDSKP